MIGEGGASPVQGNAVLARGNCRPASAIVFIRRPWAASHTKGQGARQLALFETR